MFIRNICTNTGSNKAPVNRHQPGSADIYRGWKANGEKNLVGAKPLFGPSEATVRAWYNSPYSPHTTKISLDKLGGTDSLFPKLRPLSNTDVYNGSPRVVEENSIHTRFYGPALANPKTETLLIHGTFVSESVVQGWTNPNSQLSNGIRDALGGTIASVQWSGKNNRAARLDAAEVVAHRIADNHKKGIKTNIVAHSHGGNVAYEALKLSKPEHHINQLITLATPIRSDHVLSREEVTKKTDYYTHIYGRFDGVAGIVGGIDLGRPNLIRIGTSSRKNLNADKQFEITDFKGPLSSHSSVYQHGVFDKLLISNPQRR